MILDGIRQRREHGRRQDLQALSRGRQVRPKLLVASLFGFAVLAVDSAIGYAIVKATQFAVQVAGGDPSRWFSASTALQIVVVLPLVLLATLLLGLAAGHRLGEHRKRWILFGMGIYTVVRMLHLTVIGPLPGYSVPVLIASGLLTAVTLTGVALLGAWWAKKTQAVFNATSFFRRLPDDDQGAALALLGETVDARAPQAAPAPAPARNQSPAPRP